MAGTKRHRSRQVLGPLGAGLAAALALAFAPAPAQAQAPLFAFAQFSDVQADSSVDLAHFDQVLAAISAAGQPGSLLPSPVSFVLIPGDHVVDPDDEAKWIEYVQKLQSELTAQGIPFLAVPGNHDQDEFGTPLYTQYIAPPGIWDASSADLRGQNALVAATGWEGLRFVGFNNSWVDWNTIRPAEQRQLEAIVSSRAASGENLFLVAHHPHDDVGVVPLAALLETPGIVGYMRGHGGQPHATQGLGGIANPVWDLSSESVARDAALLYYEVFATEIRAYVLKLALSPVALPAPAVLTLPQPLWPATPSSPVADFAAVPDFGRASLEVAFVDLSTGHPASWLWDFGDGASSTERHPIHVYPAGGSYDVSLIATNAQGADAQIQVAAVEVLPPLPSVTFTPTEDARVSSASPSQNYASSPSLRVRSSASGNYQSYLRFSVSGLVGQQVTAARLRLFVTDPSVQGGTLTVAPGGWSESTLTWDNAPGVGVLVLDSVGTVFPDSWVEFDVSELVTGPGTYDFGLSSGASNSAIYSSREGANPPELVVFTASAVPVLGPVATALLVGTLSAVGSRAVSRCARPSRVSLRRTRRASVAAGR
jgi:PKD repeat protein